ncbi:BcsE family c-di-GMP-binding protein [Candidatus Symbiobacter mobilis]|uniref:Cellulose biosynthesis protein BcsE n=1 Tax=Candidatus Symbiobacter mobilis CR TaxID=946483 RepID=U5N5E5_9BURK|nr:BcsE family c-di-GMP-binding protein [Candidatus Symbiobacter mobilis]AGX86480.1 cellulose biosynthesis protein BcsE [Candidatus Symbiobacter mobilis CR]
MDTFPADTQTVRLAIPGLPNLTDGLAAGGVYILVAETAAARFPMLASNLGDALASGIPCVLLLPAPPEVFLQRIESYRTLQVGHAISMHQLQVFLLQDEFAKKIFRFGADAFVAELDHFSVQDGGYLLFDQADDLLSLHDVILALDQVAVLHRWASARRITILLVLTRTSDTHDNTINALMDQLNGVARLAASRNGLELSFDYWQSRDGTVAGRSFQLTTADAGLYHASAARMGNTDDGTASEARADRDAPPPDTGETRYFYMDPDVDALVQQTPGVWQRVDTLVGMMHATRNLRSAICILIYERNTVLRQLAEAVHTLRMGMGRYARIIVQEKAASLRYQNEALLLRLGLNLVIHRDVPLARYPLLLDSLKGQIFSRDVDINFEAALSSVLPTRLHGYLLPQRFAQEAQQILDRASTLNIPCSLVIGQPCTGIPMADIIANVGISRPGDLITADEHCCYLFLNACPQTVLPETLERLFKVRHDATGAEGSSASGVDAILTHLRFIVQPEEIQLELEALAHLAQRSTLPDYSALAALSAEQVEALTAQSTQPATPPMTRTMPTHRTVELATAPVQPTPPVVSPRAEAVAANVAVKVAAKVARPDPDPEPVLYKYAGDGEVVVVAKENIPRARRSARMSSGSPG